MATRLRLEAFDGSEPKNDPEDQKASAATLEEVRLSGYETGYSAGWEDAVSAQGNEQSRIQAEVARNLQTLSFTYHEARSHVLRTLEPLLRDMVAKVLPNIAQDTLAPVVLDYIRPLAARMANVPVTITLNPASRGIVEQFLASEVNLPHQFVEEATLGEGQVFLRFDDTEQQIDLDGVIRSIAQAVENFFHIEHQERAHG